MPGRRNRPKKADLEEDRFVEWILHAVDFVKERAQLFISGAAALVVLVLAVTYINSARQSAQVEAASLLGEALIKDETGQLAESMRLLVRLHESYSGTPAAAQGTVMLGNRYFAQGRYAEAERLYRAYLDEYETVDVLAFSAREGIAACFEAKGDFQRAAEEYLSYASEHVHSMESAIALMDAARCHRLAGDLEAQKQVLQRVTEHHPNSPAAARAREELNML